MQVQPSLDWTPNNNETLVKFGAMLQKMWRNMATTLNGLLGFGDGTNRDNIDGAWANLTTPVAPNTDFTVNHNLLRLPVGYWIMYKDRAVDVYTGSVAATKTQLTLRATVASAVIRLFIVCLFLSLFGLGASAQSTTVTLQVTDLGGQTWNNGIWQAVLQSPPGVNPYGPPFYLLGTTTNVPNQSQSGALNGSGGATFVLTPNASIVPSQSQWKLTVCPQATSPCFTQFINVLGATQAVTANPPAILIAPGVGVAAYATTEITGGAVGSQFYLLGTGLQLCSVATSTTCTTWTSSGGAGTGFPVTTAVAVNSGGSITVNSGGSIGTSGTGTINATSIDGVTVTGTPSTNQVPTATSSTTATWQNQSVNATSSQNAIYLSPSCPNPNSGTCYYTPANTVEFTDATYSNGSPTVTTAGQATFVCPGASYPCSSGGDVGKTIYGFLTCTASLIGAQNATLGLTATTITTVNSTTSVTASQNATGTTGAGNGCVIYGTPDDTGTALADTAAQSTPSCPAIILPALSMLWTTTHFTTNPNTCLKGSFGKGLSNLGGWGISIGGYGKGISNIHLPPWFPVNSCSGGTGISCFGGSMTGSYWHDFTFNGGGSSRTGTTSNKALFEPGCYSQIDRVGFVNFGASDGSLPGIYMNSGSLGTCLGGSINMHDDIVDGWGSNSYLCGSSGGLLYAGTTSFGDSNASNGSSLSLAGATNCAFRSIGGNTYFGNPSSAAQQKYIYIGSVAPVAGPLVFDDDDCFPNGSTNINYCIFVQGSSATQVFVTNSNFTFNNSAANLAVFVNTNGGNVHLAHNYLSGGGASGYSVYSNAGGVIYDECGNVLQSPGATTNLLGPLYGACSATGSPSVTGNWALTSGWDTSTKGTFTGSTQDGGLTITLAGAPTTGAVLTFTFPVAFWKAPTHCVWVETSGTQVLTSVTTGAISATSVAYTFNGTLVAANTIVGFSSCGNP